MLFIIACWFASCALYPGCWLPYSIASEVGGCIIEAIDIGCCIIIDGIDIGCCCIIEGIDMGI